MKRLSRTLFLVLILSIVSACSTQKSRKDQSVLGRLYHNTTAHYNGYFNANEIMIASLAQLDDQYQDNYNKLLPVFKYMEADNPQAVAPDLDEAIKKVSIVVNLHRESVWTDDCYLIFGQAQYLKRDYEGAEETLRFMLSEFDPSNKATKSRVKTSKGRAASSKDRAKAQKERKAEAEQTIKDRRKASKDRQKTRKQEQKQREKERKQYNRQVAKNRKLRKQGKPTVPVTRPGTKKEEASEENTELAEAEKPTGEKSEEPSAAEEEAKSETAEVNDKSSKYILKHRPAYQEGVLWLARTFIERDNHDGALRLIGDLENDPGTFKDIQNQLAVIKAYLHLDKGDFEAAVNPLQQAIESDIKREEKARYAYILAQLHQRAGRGSEANKAFVLAEKYTQNYEMAFSAKLNRVLTSNASIAQAKNELEKMLKDPKNLEFQDQIYYTLGEIAFNAGEREKGIEYLQKSLQSGLRNPVQRTESYYRLAELYFEDEIYIAAKNYYDSTLQVMPENDERHERVSRLAGNLTEIATNLEIIQRQDSLLRISNLKPEERRDMAAKIKLEQDEARRKQLVAQANQNIATPGNVRTISSANALQKESTFFAYDDREVKRGKREFERRWGGRPLVDNWRRSSQVEAGVFETEQETEEVVAGSLTDEDVEEILGAIPDSEEDKKLAELRIQEAMFKLGSLYRDRLDNNERAIEVLEQLNSRFPGNNSELDSWYLLYLAFTELNNSSQARVYYDKILEKYPQSKYALVLQDPSYADKLRNKELEISLFYDQAYSDFTQGEYQEAYTKIQNARQKFGGGHSLQPRFALLAALCTGNLQGRDAYVKSLTEVVAKYPDTDEQRRAREILRLLGEWRGTLPGEEKIKDTQFAYEPDQLHYVIITFAGDVKLNEQKARLSDFNRKYFELNKLRISNIFLGTDVNKPIIVVRRFKNRDEAMRYYETAQKNSADFLSLKTNFNLSAITQNNYREVLKAKSLDGYQTFFEANYF